MVGRKKEIEILSQAYTSNKPEMIAVFGRRRVGKTYLIRSFFEEKMTFELTGLKDATKEQQLRNFTYSLKDSSKGSIVKNTPKDWLEAFNQLKDFIDTLDKKERKVIFIDELPWIANGKSDFLTGLSYFWNSYASKHNIVVVICGSATAWMMQKIINDKGGLHNRVTQRIHLQTFTLGETKNFLESQHIYFDHYQLLLLYMTMGGVPHYLEQIKAGKSAIQNINEICFHPQGLLRTEFDNLYKSLFNQPQRYEDVIFALSTSLQGLNRIALIQKSKIKDGGGLTLILQELEQSGFISSYIPFGKKKKDTLYRLTDCYSLFYIKFIKDIPNRETIDWQQVSQTQSWKTWSGYAFENICLLHINQIKKGLGISGVHSNQYSFLLKANEESEGVQIDMLIDRYDNVISLCEVKFYSDELVFTTAMADEIRRKKAIFRQITKTKKQVFCVLITTFGLSSTKHSLGVVDNILTMESLFE